MPELTVVKIDVDQAVARVIAIALSGAIHELKYPCTVQVMAGQDEFLLLIPAERMEEFRGRRFELRAALLKRVDEYAVNRLMVKMFDTFD